MEKEPEKARKMAKIYEEEILSGKENETDIRTYARLIVLENKSEEEAGMLVLRINRSIEGFNMLPGNLICKRGFDLSKAYEQPEFKKKK